MIREHADAAIIGTQSLYDGDAVLQSLVTTLKTNKGERLFNCGFGSDLESYLWSDLSEDNAMLIRAELVDLVLNDKRCRFNEVEVEVDSVNNAYRAYISVIVNDKTYASDFLLQKK